MKGAHMFVIFVGGLFVLFYFSSSKARALQRWAKRVFLLIGIICIVQSVVGCLFYLKSEPFSELARKLMWVEMKWVSGLVVGLIIPVVLSGEIKKACRAQDTYGARSS